MKQPCTPALPSRPKGMDLTSPGGMTLNKFFADKSDKGGIPTKTPDIEDKEKPMFRTLDRKKGVSKPPLPFERKEIATKSNADQKSESKHNTTMETTPEIKKLEVNSNLVAKDSKQEEGEKKLADQDSKYKDNLNAFNKYLLPAGKLVADLIYPFG